MKRILVYGISKEMSGVASYLLEMSRFMPEICFDYIVEGNHCNFQKEIQQRGGKIYYIPERKPIINNIAGCRALFSKLRNEYDTVYFNMASLSWIIPIRMAIKKEYHVYVHSHMGATVAKDRLRTVVYRINKKVMSKWKVTRLSCSSKATQYMFNQDDHVLMIHNAVDLNKFAFNPEKREVIRNELNVQSKKVMGFVGRLTAQKNPIFLVQILEALQKHRNNTILLIIGSGHMKGEIEKALTQRGLLDRCIMLGNKENVNDYLNAMDVFVLPSIHEGLPITAVEAQVNGLMCFLSNRITKETDITGNIEFLPIDQGSNEEWASLISQEVDMKTTGRENWVKILNGTSFDIQNEALRLERILTGDCG